MAEVAKKQDNTAGMALQNSFKSIALNLFIYLIGLASLLIIISDPMTMNTYFSDNSLIPGMANREFSLSNEAELHLRNLRRLVTPNVGISSASFATNPSLSSYITNNLDSYGLEVHEQNFHFSLQGSQYNGTNLYTIIRGQRSTNSESILLCVPLKLGQSRKTLSSVALSLALAKYFCSKSYWAKDVIILFVDHDNHGTSAWLDSYHDIDFKSRVASRPSSGGASMPADYEDLPERSGPIQAAIVIELYGEKMARLNIKIHGKYGQLPNLDLFNLVVELAAREAVTPYFHDKTMPFDLTVLELYQHHLETAIQFMLTQMTMKSDGLHGLFLQYSIQSLTLEGPEYKTGGTDMAHLTASLLNIGRLVEGIFRSLNNLSERFNRSYYFYLILSLRRFTSIGYYMIAFGLMVAPLVLRIASLQTQIQASDESCKLMDWKGFVIFVFTLSLAILSTFNISAAVLSAALIVPPLILL